MRAGFIWVIASLSVSSILVVGECASAATVTVDGAQRYQTIEGFGTCLIAWSDRFRKLYRTEDFQRIYVEGVGCNMLRVNMWGPTFEKPTEDWTRIRCEDFSMEANGGRARIFVDFGRGIRKINSQIKIIGTVWSPPSWMKMNGDLTVVAINPTGQEQPLNLTFKNLKGPASLKVYRTSASESLQEVGKVEVSDSKATFQMKPQSIVTFSGKIAG